MKIYVGSITQVPTDAIVNAVDTDFSPGGGVARWIAKEGGKQIFQEAVKFAPGRVGISYQTSAGSLKAKAVFHIPTVDWNKNIRLTIPEIHDIVVATIERAIEVGFKSITFPLLGAGTLKLDEKEVASEIIDAIKSMEQYHDGFVGNIAVLNDQFLEAIRSFIPDSVEIIYLK